MYLARARVPSGRWWQYVVGRPELRRAAKHQKLRWTPQACSSSAASSFCLVYVLSSVDSQVLRSSWQGWWLRGKVCAKLLPRSHQPCHDDGRTWLSTEENTHTKQNDDAAGEEDAGGVHLNFWCFWHGSFFCSLRATEAAKNGESTCEGPLG